MEQQAPNQVIGTGTLEVKPEMQAVHQEMDKIEARFEALRESASKVFADLVPSLERANELIDKLAAKAAEIRVEVAAEQEQRSERREQPDVPEPQSPEAYRDLSRLQDGQMSQELLETVKLMNEKMDTIIVQTAGE